MRKRNKPINYNVDLPPCPPLPNKEQFIANINNKLKEARSGNYLVQIKDLKNPRRTWITYEYHLDQIYTITDLNDPKRTEGVHAPMFGLNPIQLNKDLTWYKNDYYDEHKYFATFEEQVYSRFYGIQKTINEEGYYPNEKVKRKGI